MTKVAYRKTGFSSPLDRPISPNAQMPGVRVPVVRRRRSLQTLRGRLGALVDAAPGFGGASGTGRGVAAPAPGTAQLTIRGPATPRPAVPADPTGPGLCVTGGRARSPGAVSRIATGRPIGREYWTPPLPSHGRSGDRRVEQEPPRAAGAHLHRVDGLRLDEVQPLLDSDPLPSGTSAFVAGPRLLVLVARPHVRRAVSRRPPTTSRVRFRSPSGRRSTSPRCRPTTTRSSPAAWCCRSRCRPTR